MFSEEQLLQFQDAFNLFDVDRRGSIDEESFKTLVRAVGFCPSNEELVDLVEHVKRLKGDVASENDKNLISFDEFILAVSHKLKQLKEQRSEDDGPDGKKGSDGVTMHASVFDANLAEDGQQHLKTQLTEAFKVFDVAGEGFVGVKEISEFLTTLGEPLTPQELTEFMAEADPTNSGKIYYPTFIDSLLAK